VISTRSIFLDHRISNRRISARISMWWFLKAQQITLKKRACMPPEQDRPDIAEARRAFIRRQPALDPNHVVFIDETWAASQWHHREGAAARP
jgi:hypothetical protein